MATVTKTVKENQSYNTFPEYATWTFTISQSDLVANSSSIAIAPTATMKCSNAGVKTYAYVQINPRTLLIDGSSTSLACPYFATSESWDDSTGIVEGRTHNVTRRDSYQYSTSKFFNSNNRTSKSVTIGFSSLSIYARSAYGKFSSIESKSYDGYYDGSVTGGNIATITLDAPPTFSSTQVSFVNDYDGDAYVGLTTAKVTLSSLSAKYGGTISSATLTIGNQTATRTTNGDFLILLDSAGTFTPTVTVTDSRGQTTTKTLDAITVNSYVAPEVSFTLERTNSSGTVDDEGTYAVATASFNWTDAIATLSQPTVSAIDSDGTTLSVSATWYTDRALTTAVDWSSTSSWSSPKVLYGKIGTFPVNESSQITITPNDSEGSGTPQTQTLASAFYTIDFLAGGHGIAFGQPASAEGFECNMPTTFHDTVDCEDTLSGIDIDASGDISGNNLKLALDTTATSGTDKEIYDALVSLGWDSDVIV